MERLAGNTIHCSTNKKKNLQMFGYSALIHVPEEAGIGILSPGKLNPCKTLSAETHTSL